MFNIGRYWAALLLLGTFSILAEVPKIDPHPNAGGVVVLRSWDAARGSGISWYRGGNFLSFSKSSSGSAATWNVKNLKDISYDVNVILPGVPTTSEGLRLNFTIGGKTLLHTLTRTTGQVNIKMGTVRPGAGNFTAFIKGEDPYSRLFVGVLRVVLTPSTRRRWWNASQQRWQTELPVVLGSQRNARGWFRSAVPLVDDPRMVNNKGFVIVTSEALKSRLTKLDDYVAHKEALGFNVEVITEKDYGAGTGTTAAKNIRNWLHNNYKSKNLLYALMLGDSHPLKGQVPMAALSCNYEEAQRLFDVGDPKVTPMDPSDMYFADCSGASWDLNGDKTWCGNGDWHPDNGVDGNWDVLVGRIPYYGESSEYGKAEDLDDILRKIVDYETEKNIDYRYHFDVTGGTDLLEWAGIEYMLRGPLKVGRLYQDFDNWQNHDFLARYCVGSIRTGGHGMPNWQEGGLSTNGIRDRFNNARQFFSEIGSCLVGKIEFPKNLAYMSIRYGSIGCQAPTRSVATLSGQKGYGPRDFEQSTRFQMLINGTSQGYAHWQILMNGHVAFTKSLKMWTLFGDPSVIPFRQGIKPTYPVIVRPAHKVLYNWDGTSAGPVQEFDITNNSKTAKTIYYSTDVGWLTLNKASENLAVGKTSTLKAVVNHSAAALPEELSTAFIYIKDEKGVTRTRRFDLRKRTPQLLADMTFEHNSSLGCPLLGDKGAEVACSQAGVTSGGVSGKAYDMTAAPNGMTVSNAVVTTPADAGFSVSMWAKQAVLPTSDIVLVEGTGYSRGDKGMALSLVNAGTKLKLSWAPNVIFDMGTWIDNSSKECIGNVKLIADKWHHFAFTVKSGDALRVYFDGRLIGTFYHEHLSYNFADLIFAKGLKGLVDNIQIVNYALTGKDLEKIYNKNISLPKNIGVSGKGAHQNKPPVVNNATVNIGRFNKKSCITPIDLNAYVSDPEGGKLLFDCQDKIPGTWVHGSGYFYANAGISDKVANGMKTMTVTATDTRGQSASFDLKLEINGAPQFVEKPGAFKAFGASVVPGTLEHTENYNGVWVTLKGWNGSRQEAFTTANNYAFGPATVKFKSPRFVEISFDRDVYFYKIGFGSWATSKHCMISGDAVALWNGLSNTAGNSFIHDKVGKTLDITGGAPVSLIDRVTRKGLFVPKDSKLHVTFTVGVAGLSQLGFIEARTVPEAAAVGETVTVFKAVDPNVGDKLTYQIIGGNGDGHFSLSDDGKLNVAAPLDYQAKSSYNLTVRVSDSGGLFADEKFDLKVRQNRAPAADDDFIYVEKDRAAVAAVLVNDFDIDGNQLHISAVTQGTKGTVTGNGATIVYTPNGLFSGEDSFTYTVSDGRLTDTATVTVRTSSSPALGVSVIQTDRVVEWNVQSELDVKLYRLVDVRTGKVVAVVMADGSGSYKEIVEKGVVVELIVVDHSGFEQSFSRIDGNVVTKEYDLFKGWNLIALIGDKADLKKLRKAARGPLWCWNGRRYSRLKGVPKVCCGIWVYAEKAQSGIMVSARKSTAKVQLNPGWNLAGPVNNISVPADIKAVFSWNSAYENVLKKYNTLYQGVGYWLLVDKAVTVELK